MTGPDLLRHLKALLAAQLVDEESADQFAFHHELTRQAAYSSLLLRERKTLHHTVGAAMERLYADTADAHVAELAYHFFAAEDWDKAFAYSVRAGRRAQDQYAPRAAAEHFSRAIDIARRLGRELPTDLLVARGNAYETLGQFESARADFGAALTHARLTGDRRAEWQALIDLGFLWAGRDVRQAGEFFQRALDVARDIGDPATLAHSLNRAGNWHMMVEQPLEARRRHEEALDIFRERGDVRGLAETLDLLGTASISAADTIGGVGYYDEAIALFRELADLHGLASSLTMRALCCAQYLSTLAVITEAHRPDECLALAGEAMRIVQDVGWRSGQALVSIVSAQAWSVTGEYGRALAAVQTGLRIAEEIEHQQWQINARLVLGAVHLDLLDLSTARTQLERALELAHASGSPYWGRTVSGFLASVCIQQDDLERAAAVLDLALAPDMPSVTMGQRLAWFARAELALAQGDAGEALRLVERLITASPHIQAHGENAVPRAAVLRAQALMALGRAAEAEAGLTGAIEAARRQASAAVEWRARVALGRLYRASKRHDEAQREFTSARAILDRLSASITDSTVRDRFAQTAAAIMLEPGALTPRPSARSEFGGLTSREREVAALVAQRKSNRAIAHELVLTEQAVEKHVENILSKLGFDARARIAAWAVEKGLAKDIEPSRRP